MADAEYQNDQTYEDANQNQSQYDQMEQENINGSGDNPTGKKETVNNTKRDDDERKLFLGGISWETTENDLRSYLTKYGNVIDLVIKTDPNTGKSRGFGFVLFDSSDSVENLLAACPHTLNGKQIDVKRAKSRPGREMMRKVFVGGMDPNTTEDDLKEAFARFGEVERIEQPFDKVRNQKRNFCFLTFPTPDIVVEITKLHKITVRGKECDVKKATPSSKNIPNQNAGGYNAGFGAPGAAQWPSGYNYYPDANYGNYGGYDYSGYYQGFGGYPDYYQGYYPPAAQQMPPVFPHQTNGGKAKRGGMAASHAYHPYQR